MIPYPWSWVHDPISLALDTLSRVPRARCPLQSQRQTHTPTELGAQVRGVGVTSGAGSCAHRLIPTQIPVGMRQTQLVARAAWPVTPGSAGNHQPPTGTISP